MPFVVVYDACVLFPNTLRDLLIRVSMAGLVQAKWTVEILDEMEVALRSRRPELEPDRLKRIRKLMIRAVPDCLVEGYEGLADGLKIPDEGDRHVIAAAKHAGAQLIVTNNLKDFPSEQLAQLHLEAKSADDFILDQVDIDERKVWACLQQIADSRTNPPDSVEDVMDQLEDSGLIESMAHLRSS
jgi:hypothetical protein